MKLENYRAKGVKFINAQGKTYCGLGEDGREIYYPLEKDVFCGKAKYLLMDLDGTTVQSEEFWIYLIEKTVQKLLGDEKFSFVDEDIPFVSGFSTVEHLQYCIDKYAQGKDVLEANAIYHHLAKFELSEILEGRGNAEAFRPRANLKEFLLEMKARGVKLGLVTSGLDYKAIPEIVSAFRVLGMGAPKDFYDAIITGGKRKGKGDYGTLGELAVKPHPWVYKEIALGLGISEEERANTVVLEDSSAGLISGRLAGFGVIGFNDGNILRSGLDCLAHDMVDGFDDVLRRI